MRCFPTLALVLPPILLLAGCAHSNKEFSNKPPSLQVGAAALAGGAPEAALSVARRQLAVNRDDMGALLIEGQAADRDGGIGPGGGELPPRHPGVVILGRGAVRPGPGAPDRRARGGSRSRLQGDAATAAERCARFDQYRDLRKTCRSIMRRPKPSTSRR